MSDLAAQMFDTKLVKIISHHFGVKRFGTDKIFFLDTPLNTCLKYMSAHSRTEEKNIEMDLARYQTHLKQRYHTYLNTFALASGSYNNVMISLVKIQKRSQLSVVILSWADRYYKNRFTTKLINTYSFLLTMIFAF